VVRPKLQKRRQAVSRTQRNLELIRAGWIALAVICVATFALSVPIQQKELRGLCPYPQPAQGCDTFQLDSRGAATLQEMGLSLERYALMVVAARILAGTICLLVAVLIVSARPEDPMAMLVATMLLLIDVTGSSTASIWARVVPGLRVLDGLLRQGQAITLITFLFLFPNWRFVPRWTRWVMGIVVLVGFFYGLADFGLTQGTALDPAYNPSLTSVGGAVWLAAILLGLGGQIYRYARASSVLERQQTKWVMLGIAASVLLSAPAGIPNRVIQPGSAIHVAAVAANVASFSAVAIAVGIAIRRHQLWDIEVVVNRALIYGPLSAILAGIFAASVVIINAVARELLGEEATTAAGVASAVLVASVFQPLRTRVERWINTRLYPDSINLNREFVEFLPEVRNAIGLRDLLPILTAKVANLLGVTHTAILLVDQQGNFRKAQAYPNGGRPFRFKPDPNVRAELQQGRVVSKGNQRGLWAPVYLRRMRGCEVIGVLDIGPRRDQTGFSGDDKRALSQLGSEIGISVYTAQLRARGK
jgi:hypothetical protein